MDGTMNFYIADLYPGYSVEDTSDTTSPTPSEQAAVGENYKAAITASAKTTNFSTIIGTICILVVLVLLFGAA